MNNDSSHLLAILLAVLSAVAMSLGAQFQKGAVSDHQRLRDRLKGGLQRKGSLSIRHLLEIFGRPKWLSGLGFMGIGIGLQLTALAFAPLIVVQPIGAIALVITAVINARVTKTLPNRGTVIAIAICTLGIGIFVSLASGVAHEVPVDDGKLIDVLRVLGVILIIFGTLFWILRKHHGALNYIVGAGVLYGFVATLAKVVIARIEQGQFEWLTVAALASLLVAVGLGSWFVQNAYSSGPPDLVIAGLTVLDPLVAIAIAIVILNEAEAANLGTVIGFAFSALVSVVGVYLLSRVHPEMLKSELAQYRQRDR